MTNTVEGSSSQDGSGALQDLCQRVVHATTNDILRRKAATCQRKKVRMYKLALEKATVLEELLHDVCLVLSPQPIDYDARRNLIRVFNEIALEIYGCSGDAPVVVEFGSFSMDLFQAKSDLDLSINFGDLDIPHDKKIQTLCTFEKKLSLLQCSGHVHGVNPITTAKVPVLKVVDSGTGIECDISVGNMDGILKSKTLYFISLIDERFRKLCFLMKAWASAHNINSARDRTLNSLSIILLVAFHLQTRNPRILPPFSAILQDGYDAGAVEKSISKFKNYGQKNTEGVAELFFTLLLKLSSVEKLWSQGLCASTYDGNWILKRWGRKAARIRVEDFHDGDQNVSRAVGVGEMKTIYSCINLSINHISEFLGGQMEGNTLREFLFGKDVAISVCKVPMNINADGLITLWPPPKVEDKDTDFHKSTKPGEHRNLSKQPSSQDFNAGEARTEMPLNDTRIEEDKETSDLKSTQQPGEDKDQSAQPSSQNFNANVAKDEVPLSTTRIQDIQEDKDTSGLKSTQQDEGVDQSAQPSCKNFNADMDEMPLNCTRIEDDKDLSGLKSTQQPGEGRDQSAQPSSQNFNANEAIDEVPLGTTRIQDIEEDNDTRGLKSTQQGEGWDQSAQPSSKNLNADRAKTKVPMNATRIDDKDSSGRKLTQQPNEGRDQSAQPSRNQTTLKKRKRTDGASLPSTSFGKPLGYGKMKRQSSTPYDLSRREHIEHRVLSWDGLGRNPHSLNRAGPTLPTHLNETRHTISNGELCYHETGRIIPYLPTPVSHPFHASGTGNWISSGYTREADIATTFSTQMIYPNHHYNQLHFRAPHFATPSVYPTSTPMVPHMVPNRAHGTFGAGNFPSASMMLGYPPPAGSSLLYRTNSSHPQVNSSARELAWFRRAL